jgi:hypothetical protein
LFWKTDFAAPGRQRRARLAIKTLGAMGEISLLNLLVRVRQSILRGPG